MSTTVPPTTGLTPQPKRQAYVRAVGPRLRVLLYIVFGLVALLGANSLYLAAIHVMEWVSMRQGANKLYQTPFYFYMLLTHLGLGLLLITPFVAFGLVHMWTSRNRKNRRAVRIGYALFAVSCLVLITGLLLVRIAGFFDLRNELARQTVYWLHVGAPLAAAWLYWLHRLAGPRIKWRLGAAYAGLVGAGVVAMVALHAQDPREWNVVGPKEGAKYFEPSLARTATGNFIPAGTLMMDQYCEKCHQDISKGFYHSVHRFSSFNNPAYFASVKETREVAFKRDGNVQASRWCAGCHDPVPFFSGAFDDVKFDMVKHPTAHAAITCTVCHSITHVNSTRGNADFTIEEPQHYPFAFSENPFLQYVNNQLIKAKPSFHKQTFLKPHHKTAEFCSTCHKVSLPKELNHYKEFLRGQNHYDTYLLSGVSGHGARSFYYPPVAKTNCNQCHMPLMASGDFGAKLFDDSGELQVHNHLFPAANTGIAWLRDLPDVIQAHQDFMKDVVRVDIFGIKEGGGIDGTLHAPLRPELPTLKPGGTYLLENVIRTVKMGHPFTQGTADSNEVWMDVTVTSGDRVIGRSGGMDEAGEVDPWSHFVNVFMLDREGNRIDRRNPQDIFIPLYNHQIPPGAGQVVHYALELPADVDEPVTVEVKLQYRKFDKQYMDFVTRTARPGEPPIRGHVPGQPYRNELPVTTLAVDRVVFPVEGVVATPRNEDRKIPMWERWNDYGIGLFLEGQTAGAKGELRQAEQAFIEVEKLGRYDGPLNLARVYDLEGRVDEAVGALSRAADHRDPPPPAWTLAWLTGRINRQQGHLDEAERNFRSVLETRTQEMIDRKFDFSLDYEVINDLGATLFDLARQQYADEQKQVRAEILREAAVQFEKTLSIDSENVTAHYNLQLLYAELGDADRAAEHGRLHLRYKPDDNATDRALKLARAKYPAANHAAEAVVIYPLHRPGAPGLTKVAVATRPDTEAGGGQ
jgi:hypothetical protein